MFGILVRILSVRLCLSALHQQNESNQFRLLFCFVDGRTDLHRYCKTIAVRKFTSNSLRSNYSSRCSHYSQNKFGILLSKNLAKVNAMRSSIFHQSSLLRVKNLITYFTLCETVFRGPLSSTQNESDI